MKAYTAIIQQAVPSDQNAAYKAPWQGFAVPDDAGNGADRLKEAGVCTAT